MSTQDRRVRVFAPAKINLTLHVTGRRGDGYHLLDSLVVFADTGDEVDLAVADGRTFEVAGPEARGVPSGNDNLVVRAAALFDTTVAIRLTKSLPPASGIGGGSADAAATCRGMAHLSGNDDFPNREALVALGADVPVCVDSAPARIEGIGERITPLAGLPDLHAVLVNPRLPLSTPEVFAGLERRDNAPMPEALPEFGGAAALIDFLAAQRNDLEAPAIVLQPEIEIILNDLRAINTCSLARMSGSGATCFGLFDDASAAGMAAALLAQAHNGWWVRQVVLGNQSDAARPQPVS
ncbi:4-(cytidine 5'-diphospho)-2-C-methyl-D-erythritol kinase [Sulfitobacter sp. D35]|uniref:4-(cytidine 5'-diphospho)-2-C-methyl-D-erythritol kinase n=1 Tax=Sulfitobacter sp. D35 TaxID=3083252 RepID=UPI00296EFA87|nr:4-(cytidine 5'-diphospho)-2-C-methyl-D-erythritol kinase [Sulfitobacter sp. D35]MDW4499793.1 4-(cytidine 5'-diphospho)-2-C-methyl-D-erythritol kinase [Sulfitobacter sp. D35]